MSRVELTRRIGVDRGDLFRLVMEPVRWPSFYNNLLAIAEDARFEEPGDRVGLEYWMLGRRVEAVVLLNAIEPPTSVELEARIPGSVTSRQWWVFHSEGDRTLVSTRLEVEDVTDWFGMPIDRYLVARTLQADLSRTLDNLADLVTVGLV